MNRNDLPQANMTCEVCGHKYRRCKTCAQMRSRGIETWREHCDSPECYQIWILANDETIKLTKEEFDRIKNIELPEEREITKETKEKIDAVEQRMFKYNGNKKNDGDKRKHQEKLNIAQFGYYTPHK